MRQKKGFTIIEMIVTVSIVAILAAIAIPTYYGLMPRYRLNGAARQVMGDLINARMNAVKLNTTMSITFTGSGYTISNASSGGSYNVTFNIQDHYSGVTINPVPSGFAFISRGATEDSGSHTVTLINSAGSREVAVNVAGQIRIN